MNIFPPTNGARDRTAVKNARKGACHHYGMALGCPGTGIPEAART